MESSKVAQRKEQLLNYMFFLTLTPTFPNTCCRRALPYFLHGGVGVIPFSLPPDCRIPHEAGLRHCLDVGIAALKAHKHPLDVVALVVHELENHPHFNAGKGFVLTTSDTVDMEACIMDGKTKKNGSKAKRKVRK